MGVVLVHPNIKRFWLEMEASTKPGVFGSETTLIVETDLELWPDSTEHNAAALGELFEAAQKLAGGASKIRLMPHDINAAGAHRDPRSYWVD